MIRLVAQSASAFEKTTSADPATAERVAVPPPTLARMLRETAPGLIILALTSAALLALAWAGATRPVSADEEPPFWAMRPETALALPAPLTQTRLSLDPAPSEAYDLGGPAYSVAVGPGGLIVAAGRDGRVRVREGGVWREADLPSAAVFDVSIPPGSEYALLAAADGAVTALRLTDLAALRYQASDAPLYTVEAAPNAFGRGLDVYAGGAIGRLELIPGSAFDFAARYREGRDRIQQASTRRDALPPDSPRQGLPVDPPPLSPEEPAREDAATLQPIVKLIPTGDALLASRPDGITRFVSDRGGQLILSEAAAPSGGSPGRTGRSVALASGGGALFFATDGRLAGLLDPGSIFSPGDVAGGGAVETDWDPFVPAYALAPLSKFPQFYAVGGPSGVLSVIEYPTDETIRYDHGAPIYDIASTEDGLVFAAEDGSVVFLTVGTRHFLPPVWAMAAAVLGVLGAALFIFLARRARRNIHTDDIRRANTSFAPIAAFLDSDGPLTDPRLAGRALNALAKRLGDFMANPATATPVTFALTGEWGSGKSSAMRLLQRRLREEDFPTVWFNAWHHQKEEHLFASLMAEVKGQATPSVASLAFWKPAQLGVRWRMLTARLANHSVRYYAITFVMAFILALAWVAGPKVAEAAPKASLFSLLGVLGPVAYFLWVAYDALKTFKINPAVLLTSTRSFLGGAGASDAKLGFRDAFAASFRDLTEALGRRRLTIFIDDLDRCRKDQVVEVLEAVNFLVSSGDCYVVLGISEQPVKNAIGLVFDDLAQASAALSDEETENGESAARKLAEDRARFAERYLEKLINLKVAIPPFDADALTDWLKGASQPTPERTRWKRLAAFLTPPPKLVDLGLVAGLGAMLAIGVWAADQAETRLKVGAWLASFAEREEDVLAGADEAAKANEEAIAALEETLAEMELSESLALLFPPIPEGVAPITAAPVAASSAEAAPLSDPYAAIGLLGGLIFGTGACFAFPRSRRWLGPAAPLDDPRDDVDSFSRTMNLVLPHIYDELGSPRAIKRFVNRMRFLTAGIPNSDSERIHMVVYFGAMVAIGDLNASVTRLKDAYPANINSEQAADLFTRAEMMSGGLNLAQLDWDDFRQLNAGVSFSEYGEKDGTDRDEPPVDAA